MNFIDRSVQGVRQCRIGYGSVIMADVVLGKNVQIGNHVTVYPGTVIGDRVIIGDNCSLGRQPQTAATSTVKSASPLPPLRVGADTQIGSGVVISAGVTLAEHVFVGDLASIREKCRIGKYVLIGRGVAIENAVQIGEYTKIQTGAYITAYMEIEDRVFIAPMVVTTNDNYMGRTEERFKHIKGPTIKRGARIGGGALLLPGVVIEEETFVAAGSVVTKDTKPRTLVKGVPAREYRKVPERELLSKSLSEGI
ncbi:MAG: acyltransferase [Bacillota bacterium]|jgi:acetyltransferase-like isoleucine patch superfamily enzyme|nr:N-acetyltransferase [Clostridia bacterium]